jgi:serine protease Do
LLRMLKIKRWLILLAVTVVIAASLVGGAISDRLFGYRVLDRFFPHQAFRVEQNTTNQKLVTEESVVIEVAERLSPSVVTIGIKKTQQVVDFFEVDPFSDPFGFFQQPQGREETVEHDIASGFIIDKDGLIVTNRHVVADSQAEYKVITKDNQEYEVQKIYRDPVNDLAILKIDANGLSPVELGDSDSLKVGQFVVAIGTALGEFRHTVTTGVVSGLGRGITAGSPFEGYAEEIDNVIQTDAAINPGNSGGPLLNSAGQVIGVNVAVATSGENVGFALPINTVKTAIENFNQTGKFMRPFLGIRYRVIDRDLALMVEVPQGAYVVEVIEGSTAAQADIQKGDIITEFDGQSLSGDEVNLADLINQKKVGEQVKIKVWRDGEEMEKAVTLKEAGE